MSAEPRGSTGDDQTVFVLAGGDAVSCIADRVDLEQLALRLRAARPGALVIQASELCRDPASLTDTLCGAEAQRVVVGLWARQVDGGDLLQAARRAGVDPLAVRIVALQSGLALEPGERARRAAQRLVAAGAGLEAVRCPAPRRTRMAALHGAKFTRRHWRDAFAIEEVAVAGVTPSRCVGARRCGLCVGACPAAAISVGPKGMPVVTAELCTACGACLEACPTGAIELAGDSPQEVAAELATLLEEPPGGTAGSPPAVLVACRDVAGAAGANEVLLEVSQLSHLTPGLVLQCLAAGAPYVRLEACGAKCGAGWVGLDAHKLAFCRHVLAAVGEDSPSSRVTAGWQDQPSPGRLAEGSMVERGGEHRLVLVEPDATVTALLRLKAARRVGPIPPVEGDGSPLGLVSVDAAKCTVCGSCPTVCPTQALVFEEKDGSDVLTLDPSRCIACGRCSAICPERAITAQRGVDFEQLMLGRWLVAQASRPKCTRCGGPLPKQKTAASREICFDCRLAVSGLR